MAETDLELVVRESFEQIRNIYYCPPVSGPITSKMPVLLETASMDMVNRIVRINLEYLKTLSEFDDPRSLADGINTHEFGHYLLHPAELSMHLFLSHSAIKTFGQQASNVFGFFTDFEDDQLIFLNDKGRDGLKRRLRAKCLALPSPIITALTLIYKERMNIDNLEIDTAQFNEDIRKKITDCVHELEKIIITSAIDYGLQNSQMIRFGKAILPLLEHTDNEGNMSLEGYHILSKEDVAKLPKEGKIKIELALLKILRNLNRNAYKEIKTYYFGEEKPQTKSTGIGHGTNTEENATQETIEYYKDAAKEYGHIIRPRRLPNISQIEIEFGKKDFPLSGSFRQIDLTFSGGKIIPGLTKIIRREKIPSIEELDSIPAAIIMKDASGSMTDPRKEKCFGTIAGTILVQSYLRSGAEVGIALFDSETGDVFRSTDENALLEKMCGYRGGGTDFDIKKLTAELQKSDTEFLQHSIETLRHNPALRKYITKNANLRLPPETKRTDLYIITDGGISNIEEVTTFLTQHENYRPTIIHTGGFDIKIQGYDQKTSGTYEGITIYRANTQEEIIEMTKTAAINNLYTK